MRIGEFSKKHNITHDTVRHYIDMGLLIPKKEGHHYRFGEIHDKDINKIIELKRLEFSLMEIQKILNFNRIAGKSSNEYNSYYLDLLEEKKSYILECQNRYRKIEAILNDKINNIKSSEIKNKNKLGIKIDSLSILNCPICREKLNIKDGSIENNMIIDGMILCACGYKATIEDGIYIGEESENNLKGRKKIPSKLDFMESSSTEFINFFHDGMSLLIESIRDRAGRLDYVLELENCSGTFLMQYIENLPPEATYILINSDKARLQSLKENLEDNNSHDRFIFICEDYKLMPIKSSSVDVVIDHWMTKEYQAEKGLFLLDEVAKFLKPKGLLVGAYPYLTSLSRDIYIESLKKKGYFDFSFISKKLMTLGFEDESLIKIGPLVEKTPYNKDIKDKNLYLNIYSSLKK